MAKGLSGCGRSARRSPRSSGAAAPTRWRRVAGGLAAPLSADRHETLVKLADEALPLALPPRRDGARGAPEQERPRCSSLPLETCYLGTVKDGALDLYDGTLRLRTTDGADVEFSEDDWMSRLCEEVVADLLREVRVCSNSMGEARPLTGSARWRGSTAATGSTRRWRRQSSSGSASWGATPVTRR